MAARRWEEGYCQDRLRHMLSLGRPWVDLLERREGRGFCRQSIAGLERCMKGREFWLVYHSHFILC
jgi:hypothetical protein